MDNLQENLLRNTTNGIFPYRPIPLPAVNVVGFSSTSYFPSFLCRPNELLHCPLDLSLRGQAPITPPTTPSPPRKRQKCYHIDGFQEPEDDILKTIPFPPEDPTIIVDNDDGSDGDSIVEINVINDDPECFVDITGRDDDDDVEDDENDDDGIEQDVDDGGDNELDSQSEEIVLTDLTNFNVDRRCTNDENINIVDEESVALKSGELFYEDSELHSKAIEGFAKLFDKSLNDFKVNEGVSELRRNCVVNDKEVMHPPNKIPRKSEKKKLKARKNVIDDESSPVSGTFIRKLRDDEELIVRKVNYYSR